MFYLFNYKSYSLLNQASSKFWFKMLIKVFINVMFCDILFLI
ncbi:hypothetical protein A1OE_629 [Candidatus Endolissoclinum faulkneri L2]|uniref:Uncharacterized protein n=1 Tax=Candidatus Endolissoclinum faulkneri L2 TaxID=1193729 RepID=K7YMS7_9PROT|nr:hypothetical protein A1OE_629 [Candidatus Endolissoclinum faulkneri L2]